jgi:antimicrobial peptide system SdpA family protein
MLNNIKIRATLYFLIFSFTAFMIVAVFLSSLKLSTFSTSINPYFSSYLNILFPESFGFFTKSPKEKRIQLFELNNEEIKEIDLRANSPSNMYGWKRDNRRLTYELGILLRKIPDSVWTVAEVDRLSLLSCKDTASNYYNIKDLGLIKIKKGSYIIFHYEPIPWELNKYQKVKKGELAYVTIH